MEIKLEHVTKKIKGVPVLQDVTKTFTGGCIYGLSGKNGCGKTMLMRTMAGLIYPTSGVVKINGKTLGKDISFPPSMGLLIENPAFLRGYTGLENMEILAKVQGGVPQDVYDVVHGQTDETEVLQVFAWHASAAWNRSCNHGKTGYYPAG